MMRGLRITKTMKTVKPKVRQAVVRSVDQFLDLWTSVSGAQISSAAKTFLRLKNLFFPREVSGFTHILGHEGPLDH